MEPSPQKNNPVVPIAIVAGFAMVAIAIFFTSKNQPDVVPAEVRSGAPNETALSSNSPRPIHKDDYFQGNPNAPIVLIEYSDYDCPYCKVFHSDMTKLLREYKAEGQVTWVYRQFPLADLHPNAPKISEAALCVGSIGGNAAFWSFTNKVFEERSLDAPTNITRLLEFATDAGVPQDKYTACMNSGEMREAVLESAAEAYKLGARGTPYTVVMVGDQQAVINGAQPYEAIKSIVQTLIDQIEGKPVTTN